jgi:hypothetical protein
MDWIEVAHDRDSGQTFVNAVMNIRFQNFRWISGIAVNCLDSQEVSK